MKINKTIYCVSWSIGLLFATFYALYSTEGEAFSFSNAMLLPVSQSYIMPMVLVMALYLWDVLYNITLQTRQRNREIFWILLCIIIFMLCFVLSILVNNNIIGWFLFYMAWIALTILKFQTTERMQPCLHKIPED